MGIHKLVDFIKKNAGQAITPVKLSALRGQTVAVDGNILTLRFHHSTETEHPRRVVLSWYRFIRNLQSYGIRPIIVFDGKARVTAKARELERRLAARKLLGGRAKSEGARVERLLGLQSVLGQLQGLDLSEQAKTLQETQAILQQTATIPAEEDMSAEKLSDTQAPLASRFASLVLDMQAARVTDGATLSKRQIEIAQHEAQAFTRAMSVQTELATKLEAEEDEEKEPLEALQAVLTQSKSVATSYDRRASFPKKSIVRESVDVIRAMGIPTILTSNKIPQEAESLCSSLVFASSADIVLSEDTDVLAYGAPLLRGLSAASRDGERIDGDSVWRSVGLDKKQWIDFCILCGCDFTQRIHQMGNTNAYKLIKQFGSIEDILQAGLPKRMSLPRPRDEYLQEVSVAREIFNNPVSADIVPQGGLDGKPEDPQLMSMMRGFGLDPSLDDYRHRSGFETSTNHDITQGYGGLGQNTLGDSPLIPNGQYVPFPGEESWYGEK